MDDSDPRAAAARELRRAGRSLAQINAEIGPVGKDTLNRWLRGVPPPEWTKRPRGKDDLRAKARELRLAGLTYPEIAERLGVSKSTVSRWVRDLPPPSPRSVEHVRMMSERRWGPVRRERNRERQLAKFRAARVVGSLTPRELFLLGVAMYWAEGAKDKAYARREKIVFCNSDPDMIRTFRSWLLLLGVDLTRVRYRLQIHETADVGAALDYWRKVVGEPAAFGRPTIKRHNPKTNRRRRDESYHGCLTVEVLSSAALYRVVEGAWYGLAVAAGGLGVGGQRYSELSGEFPGNSRIQLRRGVTGNTPAFEAVNSWSESRRRSQQLQLEFPRVRCSAEIRRVSGGWTLRHYPGDARALPAALESP